MKIVSVWLDQCMSGMKIAESISNEYGAVVVHKDAIISDYVIEKLRDQGYDKIKVYIETDQVVESRSAERVREEYKENVNLMKEVVHDITVGKTLDIKVINKISDSMNERKGDIQNVIMCLNQVRDVDEYTYTHCLNVSFLCMLISSWMKYDNIHVKLALESGLLHDMGKCKIPLSILNKPAKLEKEEFDEIKKHTIYGYKILRGTPGVAVDTAETAISHHEKIDGSGYPYGLEGNAIPTYGKICAVADIYDAMTAKRVYHEKTTPFEVFSNMEGQLFGELDTHILTVFLRNISGYYIGDKVVLSNGEPGTIAYINSRRISRPIIKTKNGAVDLFDEANSDITIISMIGSHEVSSRRLK